MFRRLPPQLFSLFFEPALDLVFSTGSFFCADFGTEAGRVGSRRPAPDPFILCGSPATVTSSLGLRASSVLQGPDARLLGTSVSGVYEQPGPEIAQLCHPPLATAWHHSCKEVSGARTRKGF
jgi:hypothetical protein